MFEAALIFLLLTGAPATPATPATPLPRVRAFRGSAGRRKFTVAAHGTGWKWSTGDEQGTEDNARAAILSALESIPRASGDPITVEGFDDAGADTETIGRLAVEPSLAIDGDAPRWTAKVEWPGAPNERGEEPSRAAAVFWALDLLLERIEDART